MDNKIAYTLISLYLLILSLTPLVGDLLALREWVGFDTGAYYYRSERLEVRFTGIPEGVGKPRIYIYMPNSSYKPILLIDVDDRESSIEGYSFFYDAKDVKIKVFNNTLLVEYIFDDFSVIKNITAFKESVVLEYKSTGELTFKIVFKGKNYTYINGVDLRELKSKSVELDNVYQVNFTFENRFINKGGGSLEFLKPVRVIVREDLEGIVTIVVESKGEELDIIVKGYVEPVRVSPITHTISHMLNHRSARLLIPVVTLIAIFLGWIIWRKL